MGGNGRDGGHDLSHWLTIVLLATTVFGLFSLSGQLSRLGTALSSRGESIDAAEVRHAVVRGIAESGVRDEIRMALRNDAEQRSDIDDLKERVQRVVETAPGKR